MRRRTLLPLLASLLGMALATGAQALTINAVRLSGNGVSVLDGAGNAVRDLTTFQQPFEITDQVVRLGKTFSNLNPIEIEFKYSEQQPTTLQFAFQENVKNETQRNWKNYHFQLGNGLEGQFKQSNDQDWLYFTSPSSGPANEAFFYSDSGLAPGDSVDFVFSVFVPSAPQGESRTFTLRQSPIANPEPGTLLLIGTGLLGVAGVRRRRNKR